MATPQQIAANRQNAQKSTGPRTPEGKAASSQNAFKSGLDADSQFCYGEQRADFYRLQVEYFTRFSPQSPEERFHVRYPHPQRMVAAPPLPRRGPPLGIQHQPPPPPRQRPPRRGLQQLQPRLHAPPPPHRPFRETLRGIPY